MRLEVSIATFLSSDNVHMGCVPSRHILADDLGLLFLYLVLEDWVLGQREKPTDLCPRFFLDLGEKYHCLEERPGGYLTLCTEFSTLNADVCVREAYSVSGADYELQRKICGFFFSCEAAFLSISDHSW